MPEHSEASKAKVSSGDKILAEAKAKLEAGEALDQQHVRALEHPDEFAGQDVPAPDTGEAPTA